MKSSYKRKVLFRNRDVEVVEITWKPGDVTEIHELGDECASITMVLAGKIFEDPYYRRGGKLLKGKRRFMTAGEVSVERAVGIHRVGSNCINIKAKTLHLYAPPPENKVVTQ